MTIFFTADTHFCHDNIRKYCARPFSDVAQMNDALIDRWNAKVSPGDIVWHLGDFGFGSSRQMADIFERLNGQINLVLGNHDKPARSILECFENHNFLSRHSHFYNIQDILIHDDEIAEGHKQMIVMCHYPMETWPSKHYGAFHAHGHSHGTIPYRKGMEARVDVGVDCNGYAPISYEDLKTVIAERIMCVTPVEW